MKKLTHSAAFRQQKQLVYGTLDSQNDLQRAIVQVSNDVKSAEAVSPFPTSNILSPILPETQKFHSIRANRIGQAVGHYLIFEPLYSSPRYLILNHCLAHLAPLVSLADNPGMYSPPPRSTPFIKSLRPIIRKS